MTPPSDIPSDGQPVSPVRQHFLQRLVALAGKTGVPPVREDSASRLSADTTTGWKPVDPDSASRLSSPKLAVLAAAPAITCMRIPWHANSTVRAKKAAFQNTSLPTFCATASQPTSSNPALTSARSKT
jgi:hypothetical protein